MAGVIAQAQPGEPRARHLTRVGWLCLRGAWLLVQGIVTLLVVSIVVFLATQAMPGDAAAVLLGTTATPARVAQLQAELGLDQPLYAQYFGWLAQLLHGDLGTSIANGDPVGPVLMARLRNSATLALMAVVLIIPLSLVIGVAAAQFRDRWFDRAFLAASMVSNALPPFLIGTFLVAVFGTSVFHWLPPVTLIPVGHMPWWYPKMLVLPVATLTIAGVMYLGRLVRASMIDVLNSEYIEMAGLKGLSLRRILFRHAAPNAIAPAIPATSLVAAYTVGSIIVVEYLFNYPGMGTLLISAIGSRDIPTIQATIMVIAAIYFVFNRIADLFHAEGS